MLNGHENIAPNIFKIKTGKITRQPNFTLVKGQNRLDFIKYSFSQRTVNEWNKWSADCVHSSSVNMFLSSKLVYSKQPIFGLTQEWLRELTFSRLECGVHDRLHIYPCVGYFSSPGIDTR